MCYLTTLIVPILTTLVAPLWYRYHLCATSGTNKVLRLVPRQCYSGTKRALLSVYVLGAFVVTTFFHVSDEINRLLQIIDNGICIIFLADFTRGFYNAENKWKFMKWGWIDLISSIPALDILRAGRLFRLLRLLRILRAFRSATVLMKYVFHSRIKGTMMSVIIITILLMIFSAISILIVEKDPASNIKTSSDALWWTVETITSVGYGDKYPVTLEGRIIGSILMVSGMGIFGVFTAYVASLFVNDENK